MNKSRSVPKSMQEVYESISELTDVFCQEKLNEEYAEMCRLMTANLCRKRPSLLASGQAKNWAAGIVHAIGSVNFAFDKSLTPHISVPDIYNYFGVGKSSPASKSKVIRDLFKIRMMDPDWTLPSRIFAWIVPGKNMGLALGSSYSISSTTRRLPSSLSFMQISWINWLITAGQTQSGMNCVSASRNS